MVAIQKKTIKEDFKDLYDEFGECDELNFAILARCICDHMNELVKFGKYRENGMRDISASFKILQKKLIESIPEDLIMFSEYDKEI